MSGWIIFSICMAIISLFSISRLVFVNWDIKKMTVQLKDVNEHFGTNELVRTNTHNKNLSLFAEEINRLIRLYKENEFYLENRETQLKEEITNISHDLRTPLTSMKGFTQLLQGEDISPVEKERYMAIIQEKMNILATQIDLFYELSSIDSLDQKLEMNEVLLNEIVEEKMLMFYEDFREKELNIQIDQLKETVVLANQEAVERIIINVIQNVLRYAKSYFHLSLVEEEGFVCFKATNDTTELKKEDIAFIFNRSYRKDASRENGQLGLGLHIVQQLLQKQGGEVTAHIHDDIFVLTLLFYKKDKI